MALSPGARADGPAPVNLGSTAHFAILAGAPITTTGGGLVYGDVGASPIAGSAIHLTQAQVNGTIYAVDASGPPGSVIAPSLLSTAMGDLTAAINDASGREPAPTGPFLDPGAGNIAGLTLVPGLYKFTGAASISGANVTLSGTHSITGVLSTAPYFLLTLQSSPSLSPTRWTSIATNTPTNALWTFTDTNITSSGPHVFYRAFIVSP